MPEINQTVEAPMKKMRHYKPLVGLFLVVAIIFLAILSLSEMYSIQNKIKEGRYIGQEIETKNTLSVTGEGRYFAAPDIGVVNLSVVTEKRTVSAAQKENTEKMNSITVFLKDLGIQDKDLKTTAYNISPRYDWVEGRRILKGYEIRQTLRVKVRDLDKIGEILEGTASRGANQVGSLSFTFDDPEEPRKEARKLAVANAKEKAKELARELDVDLIRITGFFESTPSGYAPKFLAAPEAGFGGEGEVPNIQTGENEVIVNVTITYEIN